MIYFIYGHQLPVIKKTLKNLIKTCLNGIEQDDFNVQKLSARLVPIQEIVFDAMSLPLGSDKKVLVVTEPYFLSNEKEKVSFDKEQDFDSLIKYLHNPSTATDLIFFLETREINTKNEVYKVLKEKAKIMPQDVLTEEMLKNMGMGIFVRKGATITQDALDEFVVRCGDDVSYFTSEATKLSLYKNEINVDDVRLMVSARLEDNAFNMCEALIQGKISKALKIYYDLRINKEEPVRLISLLASQFRFLTQVSYLLSKNMTFDAIASELKCHPFRVKKSSQSLVMISQKALRNILDELYKEDFAIKSGEKDPYLTFELFLINFNNIKNVK